MAYITIEDLKDRLSEQVLQQILDDDNDGDPDATVVDRLISDAESKVNAALRNLYTLPLPTPPPNEVKRLALDVAEALAARRHPEYVRRDWEKLMSYADGELDKLSTGKRRLDVQSTPEPAANQRTEFRSGDPTSPTPASPPRRWDDMGDF